MFRKLDFKPNARKNIHSDKVSQKANFSLFLFDRPIKTLRLGLLYPGEKKCLQSFNFFTNFSCFFFFFIIWRKCFVIWRFRYYFCFDAYFMNVPLVFSLLTNYVIFLHSNDYEKWTFPSGFEMNNIEYIMIKMLFDHSTSVGRGTDLQSTHFAEIFFTIRL